MVNKYLARFKLKQLENAFASKRPMTEISYILNMDISLFDNTDDWQNAMVVRIADIRKQAQ